jgi:hypothetical protein
MRILLMTCFSILLGGCMTTKGYRQKLDAWVGGDEKSLLESHWGAPDKTFQQADGNTMYCYKNHSIESTPAQLYTSSDGDVSFYSGSIQERACETCFYINQNLIIYHYSFKGNACLARERSDG